MTADALTYNLPVFADPFDKTKSNFAAPTTAQASNGWVDNVDVVKAEQQNYLHNASTTYLWLLQQLGLAMPFNPDGGGASLVATPAGGVVSLKNSSTGATEFYVAKNTRAIGYTDPSLDPTNWVLFNIAALAQFAGFYADAGGTVDAITASYTVPYPVLVDGFPLEVHVAGANTTTTPTFRPTINGSLQTARTIVKIVGNTVVALAAGDLNGVAQLRYDLANTRWILLNPNLWPHAALADSATDATNANNINISATTSTDTTTSIVLVGNQATGNQAPIIDSGLTYNANTNTLSATTFLGNLSGAASLNFLNDAGAYGIGSIVILKNLSAFYCAQGYSLTGTAAASVKFNTSGAITSTGVNPPGVWTNIGEGINPNEYGFFQRTS